MSTQSGSAWRPEGRFGGVAVAVTSRYARHERPSRVATRARERGSSVMIVETHELQAVTRPSRRSPWSMAAVASVGALTLAIGGVVGASLVSGRAAGFGTLAAWAPADAAMYAEVDLSL